MWQRATSICVCCAFPFPPLGLWEQSVIEREGMRQRATEWETATFSHCFSSSLHQEGGTSTCDFHKLSEQITASPRRHSSITILKQRHGGMQRSAVDSNISPASTLFIFSLLQWECNHRNGGMLDFSSSLQFTDWKWKHHHPCQ